MTALSRLKNKWQADSEFRAAYDRLKPEFAVARQLITARNRAGLSQAEAARRMHTTQSAVARLESGQRLPAMRGPQRYALVTGHRIQMRIVRAEE